MVQMNLLAIVAILLVCFYLIKFFMKITYIKKRLKNIPGPPTKFFFGNSLEFLGDKGMLKVFEDHTREYGTIFKLDMIFLHGLFTTDVDLIKQFLMGNKNLSKGMVYDMTKPWLGEGLLTSKEDKWRGQRKMLMAAFSHQLVTDFISVFDSNSVILVDKIREIAPTDSLDLPKLLSSCSLDIICETTMGISMNAQSNENIEYVQSVKNMCNIIAERSMSVLKMIEFIFVLCPLYYKQRKNLKIIRSYIDKVLNKKIEQMKIRKETRILNDTEKQKGPSNLLDLLLEHSDEERNLSYEQIKDEINTFMFAGHDTTTATMGFLLREISRNQEIQKIAFEEQKAIFGDDMNRKTTFTDIQEMKYLDQIIKETLRMYPAVSVIQRLVTEEFEFKGHVIPKGISVNFLLYSLHRNEKLFPNPDIFDPTRFENPETIVPFSYIPFSTGPRNCIGQKFAVYEMKVLISKLLRNFEFRPAIPEHTLDLRAEVVLVSRTGVKVKVLRRN